jgi:site-specific DNA recombinase
MKTAAIYCRVSTDNQEKEGTSLTTQLDACLNHCQNKGYDVACRLSETYSGLTLERPKLTELRDLVRDDKVDVVVVYCLDRLSRDPTHGVIITEEMEKHRVGLEAVSESVDNSELGKLISYIRGFASKLEAQKIRERTIRGKRARALEGRIPGGSGSTIYGYDHIRVAQKNGGRRVMNETETKWVRDMYSWLVHEGLSTNQIVFRLREQGAPTKSGKPWCRTTVQAILRNPAYAGKTFVFTTVKGHKHFTRPREDWIEIPNATPPIISQDLFDAAQRQLKINQERSPRNCKHQYLLRSHVKCRQCGRSYTAVSSESIIRRGQRQARRNYGCIGKMKIHMPLERCGNKRWSADKLEGIVWAKLQECLSKPELVFNELKKQRQDADRLGAFQTQMQSVERQLKAVDREQQQLLRWAMKGFPEDQVNAENHRLNKAREALMAQQAELGTQIKSSHSATIGLPQLETFIRLVQAKIGELDFDAKREVLNMLGVTVWLDGENVEITGVVPVSEEAIPPTRLG